ncbi:MAG: hypothetical protein AAB592_00980, partial [Patescibacteria group bacterium]
TNSQKTGWDAHSLRRGESETKIGRLSCPSPYPDPFFGIRRAAVHHLNIRGTGLEPREIVVETADQFRGTEERSGLVRVYDEDSLDTECDFPLGPRDILPPHVGEPAVFRGTVDTIPGLFAQAAAEDPDTLRMQCAHLFRILLRAAYDARSGDDIALD